jgi:hypothetical protein
VFFPLGQAAIGSPVACAIDAGATTTKKAKPPSITATPRFFYEAMSGPRVLVFVELQHIGIKIKFVAQLESRNDPCGDILLQFLREAKTSSDIKPARLPIP